MAMGMVSLCSLCVRGTRIGNMWVMGMIIRRMIRMAIMLLSSLIRA